MCLAQIYHNMPFVEQFPSLSEEEEEEEAEEEEEEEEEEEGNKR